MTPGTPPTDPRGGLVLADRYKIGEPLGGGGSSQVFHGVDLHTKATVVLKLLEPGFAEDDPIVAHFEQEARLAARVRDPHLLGALDFGHDAGCRFIVYEHIPGIRSIRVLIDGRERITPERVGSIALQILSGLGALHEADIVHRDVSPGNCLWRVRDDHDEVVLADLGCAGVMPPRPPVTGGPKPSRELYGTAFYTAPEILAGDPHDRRADIWSVGALMYALLTSRDADVGEPGRWLRIAPPSLIIPSIPEELSKVVMTALAPQDQRYPSTTAMVRALRAALAQRTPSISWARTRVAVPSAFIGAGALLISQILATSAATDAPIYTITKDAEHVQHDMPGDRPRASTPVGEGPISEGPASEGPVGAVAGAGASIPARGQPAQHVMRGNRPRASTPVGEGLVGGAVAGAGASTPARGRDEKVNRPKRPPRIMLAEHSPVADSRLATASSPPRITFAAAMRRLEPAARECARKHGVPEEATKVEVRRGRLADEPLFVRVWKFPASHEFSRCVSQIIRDKPPLLSETSPVQAFVLFEDSQQKM